MRYILFWGVLFSSLATVACDKYEDDPYLAKSIGISKNTEVNADTLICKFKKFMSLQPDRNKVSQGMACYGDYFIQGYAYNGYVSIYSLREKTCLGTIEVPAPAPSSRTHVNTINFGTQRYQSEDYFPLLYVSSGYQINGTSFIYVYRLTSEKKDGKISFSISLVQTISLFYNSWTEGIIDQKDNYLWIKYGGTDYYGYSQHVMPRLEEGDVTIYPRDCITSFKIDRAPIGSRNQGHLYKDGKILLVSGVPQSGEVTALISIDTTKEEREFIIDLAKVGLTNPNNPKDGYYEPEGVIYYNDQLMICYRKAIYAFSIERKKKSEQTE